MVGWCVFGGRGRGGCCSCSLHVPVCTLVRRLGGFAAGVLLVRVWARLTSHYRDTVLVEIYLPWLKNAGDLCETINDDVWDLGGIGCRLLIVPIRDEIPG